MGYRAEKTVADGIHEIKDALLSGLIQNPEASQYRNAIRKGEPCPLQPLKPKVTTAPEPLAEFLPFSPPLVGEEPKSGKWSTP